MIIVQLFQASVYILKYISRAHLLKNLLLIKYENSICEHNDSGRGLKFILVYFRQKSCMIRSFVSSGYHQFYEKKNNVLQVSVVNKFGKSNLIN